MKGRKPSKTPKRNAGAGCSFFLCVAWVLIFLWLAFLFYCWKSGFIRSTDTNALSDIAMKAEEALKESLMHISVPVEKLPGASPQSLMHISVPVEKLPGASPPLPPPVSQSISIAPKDDIHVVFSTDCSPYQDWQTLLQFHSAQVVGQKGPITRIASGCDDTKKAELTALYKKLYPMYHVHFTPDFKQDAKTKRSYDFYNKPWGMKHWLEHADPPVPDDIVVALLDPDMVFLRPLTPQIRGASNLLYGKRNEGLLFDRVAEGHPAAQEYGLGAPWVDDNHKKFNRHKICGEGSPCLQETYAFASQHYAVGPPYIAHRKDMLKIVNSWTDMVPRVYEGYPFLLAEMYAYSMAAAHEKLPHFQVYQHMVSNVDAGGEGWDWVDMLENACEPPDANGIFHPGKELPTVVHYCQSFRAGLYGFAKRQVTKYNIFSCESPMFVDPPNDLDKVSTREKKGHTENLSPRSAKRNGFTICTLHRALNSALLDYKQRMCADNPNTNYAKTLNVLANQ